MEIDDRMEMYNGSRTQSKGLNGKIVDHDFVSRRLHFWGVTTDALTELPQRPHAV